MDRIVEPGSVHADDAFISGIPSAPPGRSMRFARAKLRVLQALVRSLPARPHAVVTGSPDEEGNSIEVVRALASRMRVYWLVSGDPESLLWLLDGCKAEKSVCCVRKDTARAYWAYVTARYVFFTHGLYGSPAPPAQKTFVNLWHGDGPKRRKGFATVRSSVVVAGTQLWGRPRAETFGVGEDGVLITGNPRVDQFARPASDRALVTLGIDPGKPLVLWLPTYRTTKYRGRRIGQVRDWSDAEELSRSAARQLLQDVAKASDDQGVTLAVKPHPLDADSFTETGLQVLTGDGLRDAEVGLYQLLARANGLITDYSSVWTDFLALDRPIGFYCPDLQEYAAGRGLNVADYPGLLPGPLLETTDDFENFLRACGEGADAWRELREKSTVAIGAETRLGATERLLDALGIKESRRRRRARDPG